MSEFILKREAELINDVDSAIEIMREAGQWLIDSGRTPSKWWTPDNMNKDFLSEYAKPEEFFTLTLGVEPAAAVVLQLDQNAQDWIVIDGESEVPAMYIHWLCVRREFSGQGIPEQVVNIAASMAAQLDVHLLRADTNAEETNLRRVYESIGFELAGIIEEDYRQTAFYQKAVEQF